MCKSCGTGNQREFSSELCIHFAQLEAPAVFVFPAIRVCLNCGFTEFSMPQPELARLANSDPFAA
jgi:hypothetical protein